MNGYELADEIKTMLADAESYYGEAESYLIKCETMLRQLQQERDLLFSAHSHEMVRADELQIEVDRLTMLVEAMTTECNRLYRVIELNEKMADRVYDFDNPLLDVCKHGNDSACKECYLETVKK
jgi:hypothetical protein